MNCAGVAIKGTAERWPRSKSASGQYRFARPPVRVETEWTPTGWVHPIWLS